MIKELFLPAKIGSHRLYAQQILAISIQNQTITCVQVNAKRGKTIIEKIVQNNISPGSEKDYKQRVAQAIKNTLMQMSSKYDLIRIAVPSSLIIFKELEVPFKNIHKIKMVLDYEIESMLPFPIDESISDFIITKKGDKHAKTSQILTATIRKSDLKEILDIYELAGISPTNITIDLFAIYSLYQQIEEYKNIPGFCVIMDIDLNSTQIALLQDGSLKLSRTIPVGIETIAQQIAKETNRNKNQVLTDLTVLGIQNKTEEQYDKSLKKNIASFFNEIQFTLNSFGLKLQQETNINKILLSGPYSNIKNLSHYSSEFLHIPSEIFSCAKILNDSQFKNKTKKPPQDWNKYTVALGTALPSIEQENFDLRRKEFELKRENLIKKQITTALLISIIMFITIFIIGYMQIGSLSNKIQQLEKRETTRLKKLFPKEEKLSANIKFPQLIRKAEDILRSKEEMWAAFDKDKLDPLILLQEITNIIDKRRFDITIDAISINQENGKPKIEVDG